MTTNEPQTEAGRALLEGHADAAVYCGSNDAVMSAAILAIEDQAATEARRELLARITDEWASGHIATIVHDRLVETPSIEDTSGRVEPFKAALFGVDRV